MERKKTNKKSPVQNEPRGIDKRMADFYFEIEDPDGNTLTVGEGVQVSEKNEFSELGFAGHVTPEGKF